MAKSKEEQIFVGIDDKVIELTGKEKDDFIADRDFRIAENKKQEDYRLAQIELRKSAFAKLGLTEEEINAIL
jgi:hypothetical protein